MFQSISSLVSTSPSSRYASWSERSDHADYNVPTTPKSHKRTPTWPANHSPPSVCQQSESATRSSRVSPTSSPQGLLSKMAVNSAPGSRLTSPVVTPTSESPTYTSAGYGMNSSSPTSKRPGFERNQHSYISFPDFEHYQQSFDESSTQDESYQQQQDKT